MKGELPTLSWHQSLARYADGRSIPVPGPPISVSDDVIAFRGLGVKNDNTEAWYLVGRANQMQDAMNRFYGFEVPMR